MNSKEVFNNKNSSLKNLTKIFFVFVENTFELCRWTWPSLQNTGCYLLNNIPSPSDCPLRKENNKCIVKIPNFNSQEHAGNWECILITTTVTNVTQISSLKLAELKIASVSIHSCSIHITIYYIT